VSWGFPEDFAFRLTAEEKTEREKRRSPRVAYKGERLEEIEDRIDVEKARNALKERGGIPWKQLKKELGL
jgi:hypothetical protein